MSVWSYSGDPGGSDLDQVRFLIQDTRRDRQLLSDDEIAWLLAQTDEAFKDPIAAAVWSCEIIAARYTGQAQSISADGVSVSVGNLRSEYLELANQLRDRREEMGGVAPVPDFGATFGPMYFGTGMFDNVRAGRQDYGSEHRGALYEDDLREWA